MKWNRVFLHFGSNNATATLVTPPLNCNWITIPLLVCLCVCGFELITLLSTRMSSNPLNHLRFKYVSYLDINIIYECPPVQCAARLAHVLFVFFGLLFWLLSWLACSSSNSQPLTSLKLEKKGWNLPIFIAIRKSNCRACIHIADTTDYGRMMAKCLIICIPNSYPNPK